MRTNISHLAERFGVSRRTATTWKSKGAPIHNDKLLKDWLASRQRVSPGAIRAIKPALAPMGAKPKTGTVVPKPPKKKPTPATAPGIAGAAQALKRLESAELAAFDRMESATDEGADAVTLAELRKSWLAISESLRKFDLLVEQNRREAGDLIPREVLETSIDRFCHGVWLTFRLFQSSIVGRLIGENDPCVISRHMDGMLNTSWITGAIGMMPMDRTMGVTIKKRIMNKFTMTDAEFEHRKEQVDAILAEYAKRLV